MKKALGWIVLALILAGVWGWRAGWWVPAPLVMGTHAEFPPFAMREDGDEGRIVGFDVDLAQAIADKAGRPLQIVDLPFDELIPALETGRVHMVLAAMTITAERAERVDFSDPYYKATPVVMIRAGEPEPPQAEDMAGQKIGAQAGTTNERLAQEITGKNNVRAKPSAKAAIADLLNSQVNYVLVDEQPATAFQRIFPEARIVRLPFPDEFYGVAVRKGDADLLKRINQTLKDVAADRRYDWFIDRWMLQLD